MPKSTYLSDAVLNYTTGRTAMPTNLVRVIRLWQTLPSIAGTGGVEMAGLGYTPYTATPSLDFALSSNGQCSALRQIAFGTSTGGGSFLEGITLHDGSGNFLRIAKFPDRQFWDAEDGYRIPAGGILFKEK